MIEGSDINSKSALLITDNFNYSVNGLSVFAHFFVEDFLKQKFKNVFVFEFNSKQLHCVKGQLDSGNVTGIYINSNFSKADSFIRRSDFIYLCKHKGINISKGFKKYLISHGWTKMKFRCHYYWLYYWIKNLTKARNLKRLLFYDELIFISKKEDNYRHKDYSFALRHRIPIFFYDFSNKFIKNLSSNKDVISTDSSGILRKYILIVANFEPVKNLWWLLKYNLKRSLRKKQHKNFVLLVKPVKSKGYAIYKKLSYLFSIEIVNTQNRKETLLKDAEYLFIPSFSEYNPIVALEAKALNKKIVSLYKITALSKSGDYQYLMD